MSSDKGNAAEAGRPLSGEGLPIVGRGAAGQDAALSGPVASARQDNEEGGTRDNAAGRGAIRRVGLMVSGLFPGGKERVVLHLATEFAAAGIEPMVVCLEGMEGLGPQMRNVGIEVHALGSCRSYDLGAVWRLRRLLRRFRPDVLNAHDYFSLPYAVAANRLAGRCPVVLTCHGLLFHQRREGAKLHHRWAARSAAAMTAVSTSVARDYTEFLTLTDPVTVIENGIPIVPRRPDLGKAVRCELGLADDVFLFVAVGNVKPEKGFGDLVVAADLLRRASLPRPFAVAIAGGPDDAQCLSDLQSLISQLRLESTVRLLGQREDTLAIYSAADAFVLSSRSEGLPLVLLEAMSAGLPVVATAVGGVPDVLCDSGGGILVEPASPPALAEGMTRLLTGSELCADLGARGAEAVKRRYSAQAMAMNYLAVFRQVLGRDGAVDASRC